MTINSKFKSLLAVALLSSFGSVAAAGAEENTEENNEEDNSRAPEATAAEAELSFWDIPILENAFIDTAPADRKDGISVGGPSVRVTRPYKYVPVTIRCYVGFKCGRN